MTRANLTIGCVTSKEELALETEVAHFLDTEDVEPDSNKVLCSHPDVNKDIHTQVTHCQTQFQTKFQIDRFGRPIPAPNLATPDPTPKLYRAKQSRRLVDHANNHPKPPEPTAAKCKSKPRSKRIESDSDIDASDQSIIVEFSLPSKPKPKTIIDSDSDDEKPRTSTLKSVWKVGQPPNKRLWSTIP